MKKHFPSEDSCFINRNYERLAAASGGRIPLGRAASEAVLAGVNFGPRARFFDLFYRKA